MKKIIFFTNVLLVALVSCNTSKLKDRESENQGPISIEGIWSYIFNDSIYGEVIFTRDHLWEYTEPSGEIYLKYIQRSDSVIIMNWNGDRYISGRLTKVSSDKFDIDRRNAKVRYEKLDLLVDTARLLRGDEEYLDEYINGLLVRKYDWEDRKKGK